MTLLFRDRPATLSEREKECRNTILRKTGVMSQCKQCGGRYRRMTPYDDLTPMLCGRCYPPGGPKEE